RRHTISKRDWSSDVCSSDLRRLYLPEIKAKNANIRKAAERTAINAPMQGSAADIIKRAMITVDHWLAESKLDARVILQVHDELVDRKSVVEGKSGHGGGRRQ